MAAEYHKEILMADAAFHLDKHFSDAFALFKKHAVLLIIAGLVAAVLSAVTFGVLAAPLLVGLLLIIKRLLENDPQVPLVGDIFKGFELFVPAFLVGLVAFLAGAVGYVLNFIPLVGQLASLAIGMAVGPLASWALALVAYRRMGAIEAYTTVIRRIQAGDFWMPLLFALLASVIASAGSLVFMVGLLITVPFAVCLMGCGYREAFGSEP
jgi:uncharacterized membrane protein